MSNDATPAATPSQPQQPLSPDLASDALLRLAQLDIPAEQRRLKQIKDPTIEALLQEMAGTQLDIIKDMARNQVELRDWAFAALNALAEHVEALDDRMQTIETYGTETTLTPEDAEVFRKAVIGAKWAAVLLLQGPFPIQERDEEGKQKLAEIIAYAEQAEKIIVDTELSLDDDDDDESDEDETED